MLQQLNSSVCSLLENARSILLTLSFPSGVKGESRSTGIAFCRSVSNNCLGVDMSSMREAMATKLRVAQLGKRYRVISTRWTTLAGFFRARLFLFRCVPLQVWSRTFALVSFHVVLISLSVRVEVNMSGFLHFAGLLVALDKQPP